MPASVEPLDGHTSPTTGSQGGGLAGSWSSSVSSPLVNEIVLWTIAYRYFESCFGDATAAWN